MGEDFAPVDSAPQERVVRNFVELVPRHFGRHEIADAAFFHNLGQRAAEAERIRQPEDPAVHAELLAEEAFAKQNLPHQRFARRQVAVGLQPHGALRLPTALPHALFDSGIYLRVAVFEKLIELRLAGHKLVARVFVHQLQHRRKAARDLFPRLSDGPPPRHVDVRMADAGGDYVSAAGQVLIERFLQVFVRGADGAVKILGIFLAEVQQIDRVVQHGFHIQADLSVLLHPGKAPKRNLHVIVEVPDFRIDLHHLRNQAEFGVQGTRIGLQVEADSVALAGAGSQKYLPVVHVEPLRDFPVYKQQKLRVFAVIGFLNLRAEHQPERLAVKVLRHREVGAEPVMPIRSVPVVLQAVKIPPRLFRVLGFPGPQEQAVFDLPARELPLLYFLQLFQLAADDLRPLFGKYHSISPCFSPCRCGTASGFSRLCAQSRRNAHRSWTVRRMR